MNRVNRVLLAVLLAMLAMDASSAAARAESIFTVFEVAAAPSSVASCIAPCTVTVTDERPGGGEHEWDFHYGMEDAGYHSGFQVEAASGSPACLATDCHEARWTYPSVARVASGKEREYCIGERIDESSYIAVKCVNVIEPGEAPAPIGMLGPTTVKLPTVIELTSPKTHLTVGCHRPREPTDESERCEPYLLRRTGPDANGLYHYRYKLAMAHTGKIVLYVFAWSGQRVLADWQTFHLKVVRNAYAFGDVHSCRYPQVSGGSLLPGESLANVFELGYYAAMGTRVLLGLEAKRGGRWTTTRHKAFRFAVGGPKGTSPWTRRTVWAQLGAGAPLGPRQRIGYEIRRGRRAILKRGRLSNRPCTTGLAESMFDGRLLARF